jgi:hypothetical protein
VKQSYTGRYLKDLLVRRAGGAQDKSAKGAPSGRLPAGEAEGAGKKPKKQAAE